MRDIVYIKIFYTLVITILTGLGFNEAESSKLYSPLYKDCLTITEIPAFAPNPSLSVHNKLATNLFDKFFAPPP